MDTRTNINSISNVDEKIVSTKTHKEVNMSSLYNSEDKKMRKLFHIKICVQKIKVDNMFNTKSHANFIAKNLLSKLGLEVHDHPHPYPSRWVNRYAKLKILVTKQRVIKFSINADFID
jgi:hypothetical protein